MTVVTEDVLDTDALTLSRRIHERQVSCREVMEAALARIDRLNPSVTAIVSLRDHGQLLHEADLRDDALAKGLSQGWMHGFPLAPKDLAQTRGLLTTMGSPLFRDTVPQGDSIFVERLRQAGTIFVGKTNTPEFGLGSQTYNTVFGPTGNAYDPALTSGGSSGGAAVALALHLLPVADGSDMMGSLRNPAAFNNVYGFRPSVGRVPHGPNNELFFQQLGYDGPMARNVADLAMLLSVMAGYDRRAPQSMLDDPVRFTRPLDTNVAGRRIGWLGDLSGHLPVEDGILDLCSNALGVMEGMGCLVEPVEMGFSADSLWLAWTRLRAFLVGGALGPLYDNPEKRARLKPEAIYEIELGRSLSAGDIFAASECRSAWYRRLLVLFDRYDALALPSAQLFPFDKNVTWPKAIAGRTMDSYHRWMEVVVPASLGGVPAISLPAGFGGRNDLPMGLQLIGRPTDDFALLQLAHAYDRATRWPDRRPPGLLAQ